MWVFPLPSVAVNDLWKKLLDENEIGDGEVVAERLDHYLGLLLEVNERMNLTRITERSAAEIHHVADALTLLPFIPKDVSSIADVGSGGGVPGLPLACVLSNVPITLIESTKKKAAFLQSAASQMRLTNVTVIDDRAENVAHSARRESFSLVTARAVGSMDWLAEWCLPLVSRGGKLLAMKGARITEELPAAAKAIHLLGGGKPIVHPVELPGTEHHVIVEIPKASKTDGRYPRNPTTTRGKPLGSRE